MSDDEIMINVAHVPVPAPKPAPPRKPSVAPPPAPPSSGAPAPAPRDTLKNARVIERAPAAASTAANSASVTGHASRAPALAPAPRAPAPAAAEEGRRHHAPTAGVKTRAIVAPAPRPAPAAPPKLLRLASSGAEGDDTFAGLHLHDMLCVKLTRERMAASGAMFGASSAAAAAGIVRGTSEEGFGLMRPTRVQRSMIPRALGGDSLLVRSETGSGKTLAFLLPIVHTLVSLLPPNTFTSSSAPSATPIVPSAPLRYTPAQLRFIASEGLSRSGGTVAIILAPTRELCQQIFGVASRLVQCFPQIVPGIVAGGEKRKSEKARLRKGVTILVATPGRLLDHLRTTEALSLSSLAYLVLDEADRLLDMGFGPQLTDIVRLLHERTRAAAKGKPHAPWQTFLLSATVTRDVKELARAVLQPPPGADGLDAPAPRDMLLLDASMGTALAASDAHDLEEEEEEEHEDAPAAKSAPVDDATTPTAAAAPAQLQTPSQLQQAYAMVPMKWRLAAVLAITYDTYRRLQRTRRERARAGTKLMIFCSTCDAVDFHYELLRCLLPHMLLRRDDDPVEAAAGGHDRLPVYRLHGEMDQTTRTNAYRSFCAASDGLLIATDVASRGLDMPSVDAIVQVDPPSDTMDYVHRVGRTARKGERGSALLMLQPHEEAYVDILAASGLALQPADMTPIFMTLRQAHIPTSLLELPLLVRAYTRNDGDNGEGDDDDDDNADAPASAASGWTTSGSIPAQILQDLMPAGSKRRAPAASPSTAAAAAPAARIPSRVRHLMDAVAETTSRGVGSSADSSRTLRTAELYAALWQAVAEELVLRVVPSVEAGRTSAAPKLVELARLAYTSFIRAYAAHDRAVRHIFHARALHLGHTAKAFGLREPPSTIAATERKRVSRERNTATGTGKAGTKRRHSGAHDAAATEGAPTAAHHAASSLRFGRDEAEGRGMKRARKQVSEFDA